MKYIDVHSHVSFPEYDDDREEVLARMRENGVVAISVGVDLESSRSAVAFAEAHENIVATVGLHPTDNKNEKFISSEYEELALHPKVVGIGECGLDYFRVKKEELEREKVRQKEIFESQIKLAIKCGKPLMLHVRPSREKMDAYEDILDMLGGFSKNRGLPNPPGNVHFFAGTLEVARRFFNFGFTVSFTGVITFTSDYDEVIRNAPLEMILSETDSPYLSPEPYRGMRNEPSRVVKVVERIAEIRGEGLEVVRIALFQNATRVWNFPHTN